MPRFGVTYPKRVDEARLGSSDESLQRWAAEKNGFQCRRKASGIGPGANERNKSADARTTDNMSGARESAVRGTVAARSGQKDFLVVIENSVAPNSESAAGATLVDIRSAHVTGDVGKQRSSIGGGAHRKEVEKFAKVSTRLRCLKPTTVAEAVAVAALEHVGIKA